MSQYYSAPPGATLSLRPSDALTPGAEDLLDVVAGMDEFTVYDLEPKVPYGIGTVRSRLRELLAAGQVRETEQARGRNAAKYEVVKDAPVLHGLILPELQSEGDQNSYIDTPQTAASKT